MSLEEQCRVFYLGENAEIGLGSSGKVRAIMGARVEVDWGGGLETVEARVDCATWERFCDLGKPGWS